MSIVALVLCAAAPALADPTAAEKETARNLMQEARDLREKKDLKAALNRFQAADQIMNVPTTAYEVAATQIALGLLVEGRETLLRIRQMSVAPKEPAPFKEAREKAEALDEGLDARIPVVTVLVKGGAGAKLSVDDRPVPPALVGLPLRVNPGHHTIGAHTATAEGETEVELAEGNKKDVVINLVAKSSSETGNIAQESNAPPTDSRSSKGSYVPAILAFGVAAAGVGVGAVTGVMTLSKQSDLNAACPNKICGPAQHGDVDSANTLGLVSTISFIAAGGCAAIGVVLLIVGKPSQKPAETAIRPWVSPTGAGVVGTF